MSLLLGLRRGQLVPTVLSGALPSPLDVTAFDTFTAADGTALTVHTADDGGTWTVTLGSTGVIDSNRAHNSTVSTIVAHSWLPASGDYDVTADVVMLSDNNASAVGPAGRISLVTDTQYSLRYMTGSNSWQLFKRVAGVQTALGTATGQVLTVGQAYRATLSLRGTRLLGIVDGVLVASVTDAEISSGGAGLLFFNGASTTTGLHIDTFRVTS